MTKDPEINNLNEDPNFIGWNLDGLDYPTFRLSLVAKVMDRLTMRQLNIADSMSLAEWRVLSRLAPAEDGLTVRQIAEIAWVDRAEVSRAAASLEAQGLIVRRANPNDGRTPILSITDLGRKLHRPMLLARSQFHINILQDFTREERDQLDGLLLKIAEQLIKMSNLADI